MKRKLQNQKDCPTKVKGFLEAFRTLLILLLCKLYSMYAPLDFTYDIIHHGHVHLIGTSVHYIVLCDSAICVHTLHSSFFFWTSIAFMRWLLASCFKFTLLMCRIHTPWSVRLCNRNSKSAKSSSQSRKTKAVQLSMDHSGRCDVIWIFPSGTADKRVHYSIPSGN